jgi:hypothetical protein
MKLNKSLLLSFGMLILACSLYRVWPDRPFGFAPQWAMAVFAGAVIKEKGWAFLLPLLSMLISDTIYQIYITTALHRYGDFTRGSGVITCYLHH